VLEGFLWAVDYWYGDLTVWHLLLFPAAFSMVFAGLFGRWWGQAGWLLFVWLLCSWFCLESEDYVIGGGAFALGGDVSSAMLQTAWVHSYTDSSKSVPHWEPTRFCGQPVIPGVTSTVSHYPIAWVHEWKRANGWVGGERQPIVYERNLVSVLAFSFESFRVMLCVLALIPAAVICDIWVIFCQESVWFGLFSFSLLGVMVYLMDRFIPDKVKREWF
jgi:hypothetical protein